MPVKHVFGNCGDFFHGDIFCFTPKNLHFFTFFKRTSVFRHFFSFFSRVEILVSRADILFSLVEFYKIFTGIFSFSRALLGRFSYFFHVHFFHGHFFSFFSLVRFFFLTKKKTLVSKSTRTVGPIR